MKEYLISSMMAFVTLSGMPRSPIHVGDISGVNKIERILVSEKVKSIVWEIEGSADIVLEKSENTFTINDLKYSGTSKNPITLFDLGEVIKLSQIREQGINSNPKTSFRLAIPQDKFITIAAGNLSMSGEVSGRGITISVGNLRTQALKMDIPKVIITGGNVELNTVIPSAQQISVTVGAVSGEITVPKSATLSVTAGLNSLKVNSINGK